MALTLRATFAASTGPGETGRTVIWEEHEDGTVSACEFHAWDGDSTVEVDSRGIFQMALTKSYKPPVPDILLRRFAEAVQLGGLPLENVSALLALCEIPLDAERLPMQVGAVSLSP